MTESKCSRGPWQVTWGFFSPKIRDANGDLVAEDIYGVGDTVDSEYECKIANAHLLAAAPDLLKALDAHRQPGGCFCEAGGAPLGHNPSHSPECAAAMYALAKARGEVTP